MAVQPPSHAFAAGGPSPMHGFDLHVEWLRDTAFRYFTPRPGAAEVWLPILIELRPGKTAAQFASYKWFHGDAAEAKQWIRIPAMYATPPHKLDKFRYCTAMVTPPFFDRLESDDALQEFIERIDIGATYLVPFDSKPVEFAEVSNEAPKHVLAAIIDDGFAFAVDRFRRSDGSSRVAYFWEQDTGAVYAPPAPYPVPPLELPPPPPPVSTGYGHETTDAEIGAAATTAPDETEVYRSLGFLSFGVTGFKGLGRRVSHGTAAGDVAYGLPSATVAPNERMPIVAVKLPNRVTENPADFELDPWVMDALYYILLRADDISRDDVCGPLPVVVNLSYGITHGPHDGAKILEKAIDEAITLRQSGANPAALTVVLPTGNWYLARIHLSKKLAGNGKPKSFALRAPPQNPASTWTYFHLRVRPNDVPVLKVRLVDPAGDATSWITLGNKEYLFRNGREVAGLYYEAPSTEPGQIGVWIAPTATGDATTVARSGTWTIEIANSGDACTVEGFVRRSEAPAGHPRFGRQARFADPKYVVYDVAGRPVEIDNASYIKRDGTISGIATGDRTVVVGGSRRYAQGDAPNEYLATLYSGAGPVAGPVAGARTGESLDVTALSEEGVTLHGVLARGSRSGSTVAVNGTSVAAPQVARTALAYLRAHQYADRADIQGLIAKTPKINKKRGGKGVIVVPPVSPTRGIRR